MAVTQSLNGSQPQFKISLYLKEGTPMLVDGVYKASKHTRSDWMDIEQYVNYPVTYSEEQSLLNTLEFTIDKATYILTTRMRIGQAVVMWGYYYSPLGHRAGGSDTSEMRLIFRGTITRMRTNISDSGLCSCRVEAMQYGLIRGGLQKHYTVYPNKDDLRSYLSGRTRLRVTDMIRGLINDCGLQVGEIRLPAKVAGDVLDSKHQEFQKGQSDWEFLCDLAKKYDCFCYTQLVNGTEKVFFTDKSQRVAQINDDIEFRMPSIMDGSGLMGSGTLYRNGKIRDNEIQKFTDKSWNRVRLLRDISIDEDIDSAYAVSRSACWIDPTTGKSKEGVSVTKNGNIIFYALDESRVTFIRQTQPELAKQILYNGPANLKWKSDPSSDAPETDPHYAAYYYTQKMILDEHNAVYDSAFRGITISASCNMDLNIRSQRSYRINGIFKWSSGGEPKATYFLRSLKHVWDSNGLRTELDFIR